MKLGLTFCADEDTVKDLHLFVRRLMYKVLYDKEPNTVQDVEQLHPVMDTVTFEDLRALQDLMDLWDESNPEEEGWVFNPSGVSMSASQKHPTCTPPVPPTAGVVFGTPKSYKPRSISFPVLQGNSNIWAFVIQVTKEKEAANWQTGPQSNLPKYLKQALKTLNSNKIIVIKP